MLDVSDLVENQETPKPNKNRLTEDTRSLADFSRDDESVSEPDLPFKSPHTLLNASQSRRMTKKTYAQAVSGGSEDEAEIKMRKKVAQQGSQERDERAPMVRSSTNIAC